MGFLIELGYAEKNGHMDMAGGFSMFQARSLIVQPVFWG